MNTVDQAYTAIHTTKVPIINWLQSCCHRLYLLGSLSFLMLIGVLIAFV